MRLSTEQAALALAFAVALAGGGVALHYRHEAERQRAAALGLGQELNETRAALKHARDRAARLAGKAAELDTQLGTAKTRGTATEARSTQLQRELVSVKSALTEREQRQVALLAEIESLRRQSPQGASVPVSSLPVPTDPGATATEPLQRRLAALEAQLTDLLTRALAEPVDAPDSAADRSAAPHQVVRIGPADAFVVLDYGADHGATVGREAVLARGTTAVGRVQISDVRARFSVAQVLPPHKGQLQPGDIVLLAQ